MHVSLARKGKGFGSDIEHRSAGLENSISIVVFGHRRKVNLLFYCIFCGFIWTVEEKYLVNSYD